MATKKPPYSAKAKVWLPSYTMELDGNALGVISSIFGSLPPAMREKAISTLQNQHATISEKEAERAAAKAAAE